MVPAQVRAPGLRLASLLGGLVLVALLAPCARAADINKLDNALKLIPADAAFYSSSMRIKEQIDIVAKSRAWAMLMAMPSVQMGWKMLESEYKPGGKLAPVHAFFQQDENKDLLALLADAGSHELFIYGGDSWVSFLELVLDGYGTLTWEPLKLQLTGNAGGLDPSLIQARVALQFLAKHPALLKVPDLVYGAKLTDTKRAEKQLKRLEALLDMAAAQVPQLKGRVKRVKVNDGSFLTLTFDGAMIPWDEIPLNKIEEKPGEFAPLIGKLKALTLTLSIGVQHDYLMVSLGGTIEQLARLGGPGPKLSSRPELKPVNNFADRKLTSIGYVSKALLTRLAAGQDYDALLDLAKLALPKAGLPEEQQKRILKDLHDLAKELKSVVPEIGALVEVSFMTDRGYEAYSYNYTKDKRLDGSKPLTLLNHVGGNPILAVVGRTKVTGAGYANFVKWVKIFYGHADEIAKAKLNGEEKDQYVKMTEKLVPLFKRLDETTAKLLLPALADGQTAFVLDAKWSSKQWLKLLPAMEKAMPLPEIGIVLGVSDAAKLRKAMADYYDIANDMIGAGRSLTAAAGVIGDFRLPAPTTAKRAAGTLYFYALPAEAGVDARVAPTAGLSEKVAALTLSNAYAERLLKDTPLKVDGGPLAKSAEKPLAGAIYFNWNAFVDAVTPWVEYGANVAIEQQGENLPKKTQDEIRAQVRTVLEVLKVYHGTTAATYLEDGATVTHSETVIKDLEK